MKDQILSESNGSLVVTVEAKIVNVSRNCSFSQIVVNDRIRVSNWYNGGMSKMCAVSRLITAPLDNALRFYFAL